MPHLYALVAGLLAAFGDRAQCALPAGTLPTAIQIANVTSTTVTSISNGEAGNIFLAPGCDMRIGCIYAGSSLVSVPDAMPLLLVGLPLGTAITLAVSSYFRGSNGGTSTVPCYPLSSGTASFTAAFGPLTATPAEAGGTHPDAYPCPHQRRARAGCSAGARRAEARGAGSGNAQPKVE